MAVLPPLPGISVAVHNVPEYADAEPDIVQDLESPSSVVVSNYIEVPLDGGPFRNFWLAKLRILPGDGQRNGITEMEKSKMENLVPCKPTVAAATKQFAADKSLSLGVSYTDKPVSFAAAAAWTSTFISGWNHPIVIFQFKYRSRADLQNLKLIEMPPRSAGFPRENISPALSTILVPPCEPSLTLEPEQLPKENILPILPTIPVPSYAPSLTPTSRAFEDLTFSEVRDLARKQHKDFDDLKGDDIEKLARQKYSEEMAHADNGVGSSSSSPLPNGSRAFEDLKFDEVLDLARNQHKDFHDLNGREIRKLAMEKHYGTAPRAGHRTSVSEALDATNGQGKRKAQIKPEDTDEDVIFVSAAKKRK
ncbi:hypothetical protein V491_01182 [Pseudogymnoascus sp. VKM F-3775]|nr:hypothetical protein V491_01182 [Pseudogymnoascus sp. VKM F-3775]